MSTSITMHQSEATEPNQSDEEGYRSKPR